MTTTFQTDFYFTSKAPDLAEDTFRVVRFDGEEEISQPFRFDIEMVSEDPEVDLALVLRYPAALTIERDDQRRTINGLLSQFELTGEGVDGLYYYQAVLVPRIWLLSLNRQNQIYQNMSVPEIIAAELKSDKAAGPSKNADAGLTTGDFELRLTRDYPVREYVVQYEESDLGFISRLMEHDGIFYYFRHDGEYEKLVITDNNLHMAAMEEQTRVPFRTPSGLTTYVEEAVHALSCRHRRIARKVIQTDYNYRLPHLPLQGEARTMDDGHGLVSEYGGNFKLPEEGGILAHIRAEELLCRQRTFSGSGDYSAFQSGLRYKLEDHFRADFNGEYIITRITHEGRQPLAGVAGIDDGEEQVPAYANTFDCIPAKVAYRPRRRTPKPKIYGILNAHVDTAMLDDRAEIDAEGRYKLVMPFDLNGSGRGRATRYVRMAQPYGGGNQGMHFPLHKGTEVIWTCIDGDPDRPIIIGSVPNPLNPSVVTDANHAKNVIRTASGATIEMYDGPGQRAATRVSGSDGRLGRQQQMQSIAGTGSSAESEVKQHRPPPSPAAEAGELTQQQHQALVQEHEDQTPATDNQGSYLKLHVPPASLDDGMAPPQPIDPADSVYVEYPIDSDTGKPRPGRITNPANIEAYLRVGANLTDDVPPGGWQDGGRPGYEPGDDLYGYVKKKAPENGSENSNLQDTWVKGLFDGFINNVDNDGEGNPSRLEGEANYKTFRKGVVWRDHVAGNRLTTTQGDKVEIITGNYRQLICNGHVSVDAANGTHRVGIDVPGNVSYKWISGGSQEGIGLNSGRGDQWGETEITRNGWTLNDYQGYEENIFDGKQVNVTKGVLMNERETLHTASGTRTSFGYSALNLDVSFDFMDINAKGGAEINLRNGVTIEANNEWILRTGYEGEFSNVSGNKYEVSTEEDMIAEKSITLQINKNATNVITRWFKGFWRGGAFARTLIPANFIPWISSSYSKKFSKHIESIVDTEATKGVPTIHMQEDMIQLSMGKPGNAQQIKIEEGQISLIGNVKVVGKLDAVPATPKDMTVSQLEPGKAVVPTIVVTPPM